MTLLAPLWAQNSAYPAATDRHLIGATLGAGVVRSGDLLVGPRAAGAAMSVDIAPGEVVVPSSIDRGAYLCVSTAIESVSIAAAPGTGQSRIDLIYAEVRDSQATGAPGGYSDWHMDVVTGTPTTGTPTVPAVPANSVALAQIAVAAGTASITAGLITDRRNLSPRQPVLPFTTRTSAASVPASSSGGIAPPAYPGYWDLTTSVTLTFRRAGLVSVNLFVQRTGATTDMRGRLNYPAASVDLYTVNSGAGGTARGAVSWLGRVAVNDTIDFYCTNLVTGPITVQVATNCVWLGE